MLRGNYKGALIASFCFLLLIIFLVWMTAPAVYNHCYKDEYTGAKECPPYDVISFSFAVINKFLSDSSAAITALATAFIAWFTYTLWDSTTRLWETEERNFRTAQRAFVFLDGFEIEIHTALETESDPSNIPEQYRPYPGLLITRLAVLPKWKNSGATPTKNMAVKVHWGMTECNASQAYSYPQEKREFFLGPHATEVSEAIEISSAQEIIRWFLKPSGPRPIILIWGRADYEDIFGSRHFVEWCQSLGFYRPSKDHPICPRFIQWGDYNRSD
jgi:hypothetical protein